MKQKYYVVIQSGCRNEIKVVSTDKTKMEILRDAMIKRLNGRRGRVELLEYEEPNTEYPKNMPEQPLWNIKRSESFNTSDVYKLDYREELKFFEESKKENEITTDDYIHFEIFVRADNNDQAKEIAVEKINQYLLDNSIVQDQLYRIDFHIGYSLIYGRKENVPLGLILNDNIIFDVVNEVHDGIKQHETVTSSSDEISDIIKISVFLKENNKQPKEKLIPRAKPLAIEYMYRRIMFDE